MRLSGRKTSRHGSPAFGCRYVAAQPVPLVIAAAPPTRFEDRLATHGLALRRQRARVLQLNLGRLCNLACVHCHVNAGPRRREIVTRETLERVLTWQSDAQLPTIDLTGGAPEMVPDFRWFVRRLREISPTAEIIDRCNLTILQAPGFEDLVPFLRGLEITIIASMPCYQAANVTAQRGEGVFDQSIAALQRLNTFGYGRHPALRLHLVYNPNGAFLPGAQSELEADYKRELRLHFGIEFNQLFTITNLPIARFAGWLRRHGKYEEYLQLLVESFNPSTVPGLMCRDTVNVSWTGDIFDCDFNQMLSLHPIEDGRPKTRKLWEVSPAALEGCGVRTGDHCFGCTAGAGSSCGGALDPAA